MWHKSSRLRVAGTLAAAALLGSSLVACSQDDDPLPAPVIGSYLSGIALLDGDATDDVVNEPLTPGTDGPTPSVEGTATVINGGTVQQTVTADEPFTVLRIGLEELLSSAPANEDGEEGVAEDAPAPSPTSTGAPARGYHQVTFPEPTAEATLLLTVAQGVPSDRFLLYYAAVDAAGAQGPLATQDVQAVGVGTGDVQVSVSWDVDSDLDLHVVEPGGEEISWLSQTSTAGGELDLDSNMGCERIDGVRNENITWPTGQAPDGTYSVRVHLWSSCGVEPTNYVVTVHVAGQPTRTYTGTLTGPGDESGEEGSGVVVTTFDVTGG